MTGDLLERLQQMADEATYWLNVNVSRHAEIASAMMRMTEDAPPVARALALRVYGNSLRLQARLQEAYQVFRESLDLWQEAGDEVQWARTQIAILGVLTQQGRHSEAVKAFESSLRIFLRHGDLRLAAKVLINGGIQYAFMGRLRDALHCYTRADELVARVGDENLRARLTLNRAIVLQQMGQVVESLSECASVLKQSFKSGHNLLTAKLLQAGAMGLLRLGRYDRALRRFSKARNLFASESSPRDVAVCDLYICDCYVELNRHDQALVRARAVLDQLDSAQAEFQCAYAHFHEGVALGRLGRMSEAQQSLCKAYCWFIEHGHLPWAAQCKQQEAVVLLAKAEARKAVLAAGRAVRLFRTAHMSVEQARSALVLAEGYLRTGRNRAAERVACTAYIVLSRARMPMPTFRCLYLRGQIALARGERPMAKRLIERAVRMAERMRAQVQVSFRGAFLDDKASAYADLVALHLSEGRAARACKLADQAKSRALIDALTALPKRHTAVLHPDEQRLLTEIEEARREYRKLTIGLQLGPEEPMLRSTAAPISVQRARAEERLIALWDEWELRQAARGNHHRQKAGGQPYLHRRLPAGGCLIEYFVAGSYIIGFVTDRKGLRGWVNLGSPERVRRALELFQLNLDTVLCTSENPQKTSPGLVRNAQSLLHDLYHQLWEPLLPLLRESEQVVVIPHNILHLVPFCALYDGERYLVERVEMTMASAREAWAQCLDRGEEARTISSDLVMGYNPGGLLPFVDEEICRVAETLGTVPLQGADATCSQLSRGGMHRVVHLAVHGEFRADNPHFSTVLMADGSLTASDAALLQLNASLVVLSGCETGLSRVTHGEELIGLLSAFLHAGCASVLASRWRVDDRITSELMSAFYARLLAGQRKAAALQQTQAGLAARNIHPFYWAAFSLIGHGGPVHPT